MSRLSAMNRVRLSKFIADSVYRVWGFPVTSQFYPLAMDRWQGCDFSDLLTVYVVVINNRLLFNYAWQLWLSVPGVLCSWFYLLAKCCEIQRNAAKCVVSSVWETCKGLSVKVENLPILTSFFAIFSVVKITR